MPDIFMHFIFRRWLSDMAVAVPTPPADEVKPAAPAQPPKPSRA
jgi:hypothetical protein